MYEKFEKLLREYKTTAYQVSKATGVSTATLTSWKKGKYTPKKEKLQKIADYFEISVDYFYPQENQGEEIDPILNKITSKYRNLNQEGRELLLEYVDFLSIGGKYIKSDESDMVEKKA